jgi:ribosomal protein S18 acetylase RimI-like enzyme
MGAAPGAAGVDEVVVASIRSLGWRTSLALLQSTGSTITDRGDHLVVRTESNPGFWWGSFLLLREPPAADQVPEWVVRFEATFPQAAHRAFGLDDPTASGEAFAGFAALGYEVERSSVMTAGSVDHPQRAPVGATCRPLVDDDDWAQHVGLSLTVYPTEEGEDGRAFVEVRAAVRRRAVAAGAGFWVGAFVDGRLVSQLGVLRAGGGLGRYQDVETHPDFRRRGLAGTLVAQAGETMLDAEGVHTLVMVADPDDEAIRLYRSLGFVESEHQLEASLAPR